MGIVEREELRADPSEQFIIKLVNTPCLFVCLCLAKLVPAKEKKLLASGG